MAKVSFNDEPKINVNLQGTNQINATMQQTETTNVDLPPINYIPGYKEAEAERRANEVVRQENETQRIALYEDMEYKLETGYFNGEDGEDGFSPIANVSKTGDTATITITDKDGTTTASISDGTDGVDGQDGQDGYSPTATVTKSGKVATITITDKDGTTTAEIRDGEDGTGTGDMLKSTYDTNDNGIVDNAEKVNNHTVGCDVPADAVFTDTTYTAGTGIDITNGVISNTQTSANWGNITGTLSDQTDLQNALDGKADNSDIPTKTSDLTNDSGFITGYTETDPVFSASAASGITSSDITTWDGKQDTLVSGTNIKTINNTSLLGSGDITINADDEIAISTTQPTDNETVWIDPNESVNVYGNYIANTYGTSQAIGYSQEYSNNCNTYSTSETDTGKTWIDGSKIYRKVIDLGTLPNNTNKSVSTGLTIANIRLTSLTGVAFDSTGNYQAALGDTKSRLTLAPTNNVVINTTIDFSAFTGYAILEYIKTS